MLFVCHSKILHKYCFQFLLGVKMAPRETTTMLMQNLRWQTKSIMVCYSIFWSGQLKASLEKNEEQTCHNVYVVWHKSQTSKTNITKHDNLRRNQQQKLWTRSLAFPIKHDLHASIDHAAFVSLWSKYWESFFLNMIYLWDPINIRSGTHW